MFMVMVLIMVIDDDDGENGDGYGDDDDNINDNHYHRLFKKLLPISAGWQIGTGDHEWWKACRCRRNRVRNGTQGKIKYMGFSDDNDNNNDIGNDDGDDDLYVHCGIRLCNRYVWDMYEWR